MNSQDFRAQFPQNTEFTIVELTTICAILNTQGDSLLNERPTRTAEALGDHASKLATAHEYAATLREQGWGNLDWWTQAAESFRLELERVERKIDRVK